MKILVVSSYLPYPLTSGGHVRLYNLLKELSNDHDITLICEMRQTQSSEDIRFIEKICKKVITVPRRKQWSMQNIINAAFSNSSFLVTGHTLPEMKREIAKELRSGNYDLIHVETFYVLQNIPQQDLPVVLVEHNIEYNVYKKYSNRAYRIMQPLLNYDIRKIRREEIASWKRADKVVAVSQEDATIMEKLQIHPILVQNGVNTDQFVFKNKDKVLLKKEKKVLFIGDFSWIQNIDSVNYIIKDIWPEILKRVSQEDNIKLWIVSRTIPESIKKLSQNHDVIFDEKSSYKSTPEIFQEAIVLLAPIRIGGGTSYKILESMSSGTPVVTMQMSAKAINAQDAIHLMVGDSRVELAHKTVLLLKDQDTYEKIAKEGRKLIEQHYTWKMIAKNLEKAYSQAIYK